MEEIWKAIPKYEGIYEASNLGRIRTTEGKKTYSVKHGERCWKSRILKNKESNKVPFIGYRVTLWKDKIPKDYLVHRLIATTFLENLIDTEMTVNHKDGNRRNNNVENLEWMTREDNIRHAFENDLQTTQRHIVITNTKTGAKARFRSMSQAGQFFNNNTGYISSLLKKNRTCFTKDGIKYLIEVLR